ncbi:transient receptor potential cation channel subfamily A member 1-like [Ptychodera flava]|uniref:transient receptor potential cation channel subfamily A member 1-like n=1 Tax=Ptychodera flava TaxID=63121 RepID=UPI00396AB067
MAKITTAKDDGKSTMELSEMKNGEEQDKKLLQSTTNGTAKKKQPHLKKASRSSRGRESNQLKNLVLGMETSVPDIDDDDDSELTIWQAAMLGREDICDYLLEHDRELVNKFDSIGAAPLHYAVRFNHKEVVKLLLNYGADTNLRVHEYKQSALHFAARRNFTNILRRLLANRADVNIRDFTGAVPLHYSARYGHLEITEILLRSELSEVNKEDDDKMTPLHHAAMQGNVPMCQLLLKYGADLRAKEINDITPLMFAAIRGNIETMKFIIDAGKYMNMSCCSFMADVDDEGSNVLHLAVARSHIEAAVFCLNEGADINSKKFNGHTPLHIAAVTGNAEVAAMLIRHEAKVNAKDEEQMTPLHRASLYSRMEVMKLLIENGAALETPDLELFTPMLASSWKGQTAAATYLLEVGALMTVKDREDKTCLHWAVEGNHYEYAQMLMRKGGQVLLEASDKKEQTCVHYAAESGNAKILSLLLEHGAKSDTKDIEERLPIHVASENGRLECVQVLAKHCPTRINDDDADGRTPLLLASEQGHEKLVQHLLKVGADIASRDETRRTALAIAAKEGHVDTVKVLVKNHADIDAMDKNRNTPLHLSAASGHTAVTRVLLERGADPTLRNDKEYNCLDTATANLQEDTAIVIVQHKRWQDVLSQVGPDGYTSFNALIERLPDVAMVVLDKCVKYSHTDRTNPNLRITYNYKHIDPGPDSPITKGLNKRWSALKPMVHCGREELLKHEVSKTLLDLKWKKFAFGLFVMDFAFYVLFLVSITMYALTGKHILQVPLDEHGCPKTNMSDPAKHGGLLGAYRSGDAELKWHIALEVYVLCFIVVQMVRELVEMYKLNMQYMMEISNYVDWGMYVSTFMFILPPAYQPCVMQWKAGAVAIFFAWMNLILYFRRIDVFGIYIVMFFEVVKSFAKALVVILLFIAAFSFSFYMLLQKLDTFSTPWDAAMKVLVMTIGELDYADMFHNDEVDTEPFETAAQVLFVVFLFLMPIVLMNLMVGIAVGDITIVQEGAYIEKVEMQIELIEGIERAMPRWLQRRFYTPKLVVVPYKQTKLQKLKSRFSRRKDKFKVMMGKAVTSEELTLDDLKEYVEDFKSDVDSRLKLMGQMMELQSGLLQKMAGKMDVQFDDADFRAIEDAIDHE